MRQRSVVFVSIALLFVSYSVVPQLQMEKPVEKCTKGLEQCVAARREEWANRGTLGMMIHPLGDDAARGRGARWMVHQVIPGGAAENAGVMEGDLLVEWNQQAIPHDDLKFVDRALESTRIGDKVAIRIRRRDGDKTLNLTAQKPEEVTIEYWLLFYVHENFSAEEFQEYQRDLNERLSSH